MTIAMSWLAKRWTSIAILSAMVAVAGAAFADESDTPVDTAKLGEPIPYWELDLSHHKARKVKNIDRVDHLELGFRWDDETGKNDEDDEHWCPQGITGLDKGFIVVTWYSKHKGKAGPNQGVRFTFVKVAPTDDKDFLKYAHVLTVRRDEEKPDRVFKPMIDREGDAIHAGGLANRDNKLYMAVTSLGFFRFDAMKIYRAESGKFRPDDCGYVDGKVHAFRWHYILPQTNTYKLKDDGVPRFSYVSEDRTGEKAYLISGNYHWPKIADYNNPPSAVVWWPLDDPLFGAKPLNKVTLPDDITCVQGADVSEYKGDLVVYLSRSRQKTLTVLRFEKAKDKPGPGKMVADPRDYDWPAHCEDLYISKAENIWCLTEAVGEDRVVWKVDVSDYPPHKRKD